MIPTVVLERFPAGQVMITQGAFAELAWEDVSGGLARHILGDWGELGEADRKRNDDPPRGGRTHQSMTSCGPQSSGSGGRGPVAAAHGTVGASTSLPASWSVPVVVVSGAMAPSLTDGTASSIRTHVRLGDHRPATATRSGRRHSWPRHRRCGSMRPASPRSSPCSGPLSVPSRSTRSDWSMRSGHSPTTTSRAASVTMPTWRG